jgi:signal transduction histidine kinase/ActR/RegA family two-component response regulator
LQPLLVLSGIAALSGIAGMYWLESNALQKELQHRGQLLSTALIISAETSSSLADFHRTVLSLASEPRIDRIMLLDQDYQPIFSGDSFSFDKQQEEFNQLKILAQQAKDTRLSIGAVGSFNNDIYKVVSLIYISALPQANVLKPKASILLVSLNTAQAKKEAIVAAIWITALFITIGLIAFSAIYFLLNKLVLIPSQRIVTVMKAQGSEQNESTGFIPEHELGLIGQTLDNLTQTLNAREQLLKQALIKAQDASIAKSQFLASMSHEIRTPMNGVIGMLHLLNQETLNEKQQHYTQVAKTSADSLLTLINDILDVSKIEAGKLDIEIIDFDIHELFNDLVTTMSHRIRNQEVELILDIQEINEKVVQGDPGRLQQILTNLLSNAIKFTQQGKITIRASLSTVNQRTSDEHNDFQLHCDIIDTGIGIANNKLSQLFESFTQADSSTTRKYGGTGLGLSIAKQLCQLMGGEIDVSSELDRGSQFSFSIKLGRSDALSLASPNREMSDSTSSQQQLEHYKNLNILLVEDNTINQLVALSMLKNLGLSADVAENGEEAIAKLKESGDQYYSVILMDCQMPVMDGFTATQNIRNGDADEGYCKIPIIAMTANAMQGDREECINAGMSDYLTKPIDEKLLADCLVKWFSPQINEVK